jgi:glucose-1-phosphate thymidylyltransferase
MINLKIVIPMAGMGKRLAPLTNQRPKPLVRLANKRLLDHVLDIFQGLEETYTLEYVFIIGHLSEQIKEHMENRHPHKNVTYYVQDELVGQSHAVYLAKDIISGPILLTYCDTINEVDFSFLPLKTMDGIASVKEVDDPSRHGVAVAGPDELIMKLIEKPKTMEHNLALTGVYYFSVGERLIKAIETQIERGTSLNNEYYLADAINIMIENGARIRTENVKQWLDAGTPEAVLETNAYLLQHRSKFRNEFVERQSNVLIPPIYIHESSRIENSTIGPYVAIGADCTISGSFLKNSIVDDGSTLANVSLEDSLVGKDCSLRNVSMQSIVADGNEIRAANISVL